MKCGEEKIFRRIWEAFLEYIPSNHEPIHAHADLCGKCTAYAKDPENKKSDTSYYCACFDSVDMGLRLEKYFMKKIEEYKNER